MIRKRLSNFFWSLAEKMDPETVHYQMVNILGANNPEPVLPEVKKPTARDVVDAILDRPIEWVDWRELPYEARKNWGGNAKIVLENQAFQAVFGKKDKGVLTNGELVKGLIESAVRKSNNWQQIQDVRMTINGIELARELLEEMLFKEVVPTTDNINSAI